MRGFYPLISDLPLFNWGAAPAARKRVRPGNRGARKFKLTDVGRGGGLRGAAAEDAAVRSDVAGGGGDGEVLFRFLGHRGDDGVHLDARRDRRYLGESRGYVVGGGA